MTQPARLGVVPTDESVREERYSHGDAANIGEEIAIRAALQWERSEHQMIGASPASPTGLQPLQQGFNLLLKTMYSEAGEFRVSMTRSPSSQRCRRGEEGHHDPSSRGWRVLLVPDLKAVLEVIGAIDKHRFFRVFGIQPEQFDSAGIKCHGPHVSGDHIS